jgi:hypothetical protein
MVVGGLHMTVIGCAQSLRFSEANAHDHLTYAAGNLSNSDLGAPRRKYKPTRDNLRNLEAKMSRVPSKEFFIPEFGY